MKVQITIDLTVNDGDDLSLILDGANSALHSLVSTIENETGFSLYYDEDDAVCVSPVK